MGMFVAQGMCPPANSLGVLTSIICGRLPFASSVLNSSTLTSVLIRFLPLLTKSAANRKGFALSGFYRK
jgi:hypothetical protein